MGRLPLLPQPRLVRRKAGFYELPAQAALHLEASLPRDLVLLPLGERIREAVAQAECELELITGPVAHPCLAIRAAKTAKAPNQPGGYRLEIDDDGVCLQYREESGLRAAVATLRQLLREYGRRLPRLAIEDYPDFPKRGVMLDVSRGRVPNLATLLTLAEHLADFKINELQLYTEHTFAYRNYEPVWKDWGALTGEEILLLDVHCRRLGIELVPNQNSFGHLRYWLEYPPLKALAEVAEPYEGADGTFLRYPTTLAPRHPRTLPFLRTLYDELLPHFSSNRFNVGCDETWDLGRGQSRRACETLGKGKVYVEFLKNIHREVAQRGRQMMFWGDIILHHPELLPELPQDVVALNWGYEADHPFPQETATFAKSGVAFYVCPGTSTWMSLIGRHDIGFANLKAAAKAGKANGALGYLNTDWGDGGHPQPLAVSYAPFVLGAAAAWGAQDSDEELLPRVLSREIFDDPTGNAAQAALALGVAHLEFEFKAPNVTPFGAVIAAPPPAWRELFCRGALKYYAQIPEERIERALEKVENEWRRVRAAKPTTSIGATLALELDFAASMSAQSCRFMLWQQAMAARRFKDAKQLAVKGVQDLRALREEFDGYWGLRNKGTTQKCSAFLDWRIADYQKAKNPGEE